MEGGDLGNDNDEVKDRIFESSLTGPCQNKRPKRALGIFFFSRFE